MEMLLIWPCSAAVLFLSSEGHRRETHCGKSEENIGNPFLKWSSCHVSFGYMADSCQWSMIRWFIALTKDIEADKAPLP